MRLHIGTALAVGHLIAFSQTSGGEVPERPNVILIVCDNLGYGDVGCYGSKLHNTPHIDRMATEGLRFTDFYVTSGVCTPSRASIMTGCYPRRVNLHVSDTGGRVLQPVSPKGLHPDEITIAEVLKSAGYATAIIGKWHLGDQLEFLPTRQGFDSYLGIPYSDDMTARKGKPWPPLPLMRDESVIDAPADRNELTRLYTQEAVRFIAAHKNSPFFLYIPQAMPGSTAAPFASKAFRGRSKNGPYGDSVEELDWSTGEILKAVRENGVENRTLVIWTSDNGAPRRNPPQGSNAPLKGWGYDVSEGGMRVPCIARWPGVVPAGKICSDLVTAMDFYPTFAALARATLPEDRRIDGKNILALLTGELGAKSPHKAFYYYYMEQLQAVRSGAWKLYLPLANKIVNPARKRARFEAELYNLDDDLAERQNVAELHPQVVARLRELAERARADVGDDDVQTDYQRPAGWVEQPQPRVVE